MLRTLLVLPIAVVALDDRCSVTVGEFRVQTLSSQLLRVEPRGPKGFEDRTTLAVVDRDWGGIQGLPNTEPCSPILRKVTRDSVSDKSKGHVTEIVTTDYTIHVRDDQFVDPLKPSCSRPAQNTGVVGAVHSVTYRDKRFEHVENRAACCSLCEADPGCYLWVYEPDTTFATKSKGGKCMPYLSIQTTRSETGKQFAYSSRSHYKRPSFQVLVENEVVYDSALDQNFAAHLLHFPGPADHKGAYALIDRPRVHVPAWGPSPMPTGLTSDTNGYDFTNQVDGDTYVFLLGNTLNSYFGARKTLQKLTGPTPILPDYAYGIWMTRWQGYSEDNVKYEVERFEADKLPLDVRGLDTDWRNATWLQDWYYTYPSIKFGGDPEHVPINPTNHTPNPQNNISNGEWFSYLHSKKLQTFLSDHAYPVAQRGDGKGQLQLSQMEVEFRYNGLKRWMELAKSQGVNLWWWIDPNWSFSLPPPYVDTKNALSDYKGLTGTAWGSHIYHENSKHILKEAADRSQLPLSLSKFTTIDWRTGLSPTGFATHPSVKRYPVWWTGDWVDLYGSLESMVDAGVHGLMPFVHSDCVGDHRPQSPADQVRWFAHCSLGTIMRIHDGGGDLNQKCDGDMCGSHLPWAYTDRLGPGTENAIRRYLKLRTSLAPAFIASGRRVSKEGFPFVARGDLYWPEHAAARSNQQYILMDDILVAPSNLTCWERAASNCGEQPGGQANTTVRDVWLPPGVWEDAWTGQKLEGPRTLENMVVQFDQIPMWFREGAMIITVDNPGLRVTEQDWSRLTLNVWPDSERSLVVRRVYERGTHTADSDSPQLVSLSSVGNGKHQLRISPGVMRSWTVRLHLSGSSDKVESARFTTADESSFNLEVSHIQPSSISGQVFPLSGRGSPPAKGVVAEIEVPLGNSERELEIVLSDNNVQELWV